MTRDAGAAKKRADELAFEQGLARSRSQAQAMIMAGEVFCGDIKILKAGEKWRSDAVFSVSERRRFVSRGGFKLEGALSDLGVDPDGLMALDVGASTGGFTDCLLQHGAAHVTAVDVGRNLIDWGLRQDARVTVVEGVNARRLAEELQRNAPHEPTVEFQKKFDLAVMDVSFISLELIIGQAALLMKPGGLILAMVKPQFEVGREKVGKKGVVKNQADIDEAVDRISSFGSSLDPPWFEIGRAPSRLAGPEGNREVFLLFSLK